MTASLIAAMAAVWGIVGSVLLGRLLVGLCLERRGQPAMSTAECWGLAAMVGPAATAWLSFWWSLAGCPLGFALAHSLTAVSVLCGLGWCWRRSPRFSSDRAADNDAMAPNTRRQIGSTPHRHPPKRVGSVPLEPSRDDTAATPLIRCLQAVVIGVVIATTVQLVLTPQRFWDERSIFGIKSAVLFQDGTVHSPRLQDPDFVQYHPRYPLLIPLLQQHTYALAGQWDDRWSKLWVAVHLAGLMLCYAGVVARTLGEAWGWLAAALLGLTPALVPDDYGFACAQADAPMAAWHGVTCLLIWRLLHGETEERRTAVGVLAGVCAASAAFTKDEGLAFLMIDGIAVVMAMLCGGSWSSATNGPGAEQRTGHQPPALRTRLAAVWPSLLLWGLVSTVMLSIWWWHRRSLPETTEMNYLGRMQGAVLWERISTLGWSVPHLIRRMFWEWQMWGLQWWLALAAMVTSLRRLAQPAQQFLVWNLVGSCAALLVAGMVAPAELEEHLGGSTHRYLMQLSPLAILLMVGCWGHPRVMPTSASSEPSVSS
jgi:hypothetical protein